MKEFAVAALPFIIIGICIAIICANGKKYKQTYISEGLAIGMCFGVAVASTLNINLSLGISIGMLIGEAIGISIEKKLEFVGMII